MFQLNQELSLIQTTAEVDFLQLCNPNQIAQLQQSNRSGSHYFIVHTKNLFKMAATFCCNHSSSFTRSFRPSVEMCQAYIAKKKSPYFSSLLITLFFN